MRKHLPNILLLAVILVNLGFIVRYIINNGLGLFLSTTGFVLLIIGVIIFIFFLSIDPGYGWIQSMDLRKNYIMIFLSMAVCSAGLVLVVTGQHLADLRVVEENSKARCRELVAGNGPAILKKDWYSLRDHHTVSTWNLYLFQNKGDRNRYKVIATSMRPELVPAGSLLTVNSDAIPSQITAIMDESVCPGVFEQDINIGYEQHQALGEQVRFDIGITPAGAQGGEGLVRLQLENKPEQDDRGEEAAAGSGNAQMKSIPVLVIGRRATGRISVLPAPGPTG